MTDTLPGLLAAHAERAPRGIALRQKRLGIWQETTWRAYLDGARAVALGLDGLGLRPGDGVALIGGHRVQWLEAELGVMAAGGVAVPVTADSPTAEIAALLRPCAARFAVVEGQEPVDKLLACRTQLPNLERVLYWDPRGMRAYHDSWLQPLWEVTGGPTPPTPLPRGKGERAGASASGGDAAGPRNISTNREEGRAGFPLPFREGGQGDRSAEAGPDADRFSAMLASLAPDTVAAIVFTNGQGGAACGVRLTHANLIAAARALVEAEALDARGDLVSFAPQGWIGDRAFATAAALVTGCTVNLPEEPETVLQDIQEIGPRLLVGPPLLWERLHQAALARAAGAGRLRRAVIMGTLGLGNGPRLPGLLGDWLVRRPVRDALGLLRLRRAYSAGAPLSEQAIRFLRTAGVPLRQVYLVTAAGGPVTAGETGTGRALPGVELRLGTDGEILVRGPGVVAAEQGAAAPVTHDGWLHTGDLGRLEPDGSLVLLDRTEAVAGLADGTRVLPGEIERRLTESPYVRHAVAVAAGRPYVAALIAIDGPAVNAWAEHRGMSVTTYAELSRQPEVRELVRAAVQEANGRLPEPLRVRRFVVLDRELSVAEGELTHLRTIRRSAVLACAADLIDTLYGTRAAPDSDAAIMAVDDRTAAVVGT